MERDSIVILDFGSQYTQLIARRLRELQVYSEIVPPNTKAEALAARGPRGIVLAGGPDSVHQRGAPRCDRKIFTLGVPIVGICYGMQLLALHQGGTLHHHIPLDLPEASPHQLPESAGRHTIALEPGSRTAEALGGQTAEVDNDRVGWR